MEEMNRSNDQGLGLPVQYIMLFFVCTVFSFFFCIIKHRTGLPGVFEVPSRFELENKGFADLRLTTWLWHHKKWSGRRDSDPRHPPWQGGTLPTELLPHECALGRNRTTDTVIFSHMLYRLSYQGRYGDPEGARTLDLQRDRLAL